MRRTDGRPRVAALVAASGVLILGGCVSGPGTAPESVASTLKTAEVPWASIVVGDGLEKFPSDSLEDWVSYADAVVAVQVAEVSQGSAERDADVGLETRGRLVELQVLETLWQRESGPEVPGRVDAVTALWVTSSGHAERLVVKENSLTFEAGRKYVVPIYFDGPSAAWVAMTGAALPYDGGVVGRGEAFVSKEGRVAAPHSDAGREIWGGDATVVRQKLGVAVPEPASQKHLDLPAPQRYVAAQEDIRGAAQ